MTKLFGKVPAADVRLETACDGKPQARRWVGTADLFSDGGKSAIPAVSRFQLDRVDAPGKFESCCLKTRDEGKTASLVLSPRAKASRQ